MSATLAAAQVAAKPIGFLPYLESQLNLTMLEDLAKKLVTYAETHIPGQTGDEKKAWCVTQAETVLKGFANYIPVLSQWMKMDVVVWIADLVISQLIQWAWLIVFGPDKAAKLQAAAQSQIDRS